MTPNEVMHCLDVQLKNDDPEWNTVYSALVKNGAQQVVRLLKFNGENSSLHVSCYKKAPIRVVQLLVQQDCTALQKKNVHGDLPLHVACTFHQSFEVIEWLIQKYPNALWEKNKRGYLPLHGACAFEQSFEVIQWLVQQFRNALKEKDFSDNLPLHLACGKQQSIEVLELLVRKHPDAIKEKNKNNDLPLHFACTINQSFEMIKWLVQQFPDALNQKNKKGLTPLDIATYLGKDQSMDPRTVEWLEKVASGQIILKKSPPAQQNVSSQLSEVVATNLDKLPVATSNDCLITLDGNSVLAILEGKHGMVEVRSSAFNSIRTGRSIGNGCFGPVYKGTDKDSKRSFAIKAISTDLLWDGHSTDVQKAKETFLTEMKVFSLFRHPNIESLYAYTFPDDIKTCCYLVCELAEKGSLANFWQSELGPDRLSLFRRRIQIALDVMTAIQFLHIGNDQISGSCHGYIKAASLVLKRDFTAQLIDCGLARFVFDRKESQSKTTVVQGGAGYHSPEYGSGGVTLERSWDIFSFGVVLAELLTGKVQSHEDECGASCNFEMLCVQNEKGTAQDIIKYLDPALGYDTWELPKYVKEFADLAICCMQPKPEDRPTGEAVMEKLWTILSQCCSRNCSPSSGNPVGDSLPRSLELKSQDKCKFCRTFPSVSPQRVCAVCKSSQERRAQVSFCGESRHFAATNAELNVSLPLLSCLDIRLNNPIPRLFVIVPCALKSALTDPKAWFRSHHRTRCRLYFVCIHSLKAIAPPVTFVATKCWLEKVAPVLAMSLYLLQLGIKPGDCLELDFEDSQMTLKLSSTRIEQLLEAVTEILTDTGSSDVLVRLRRNEVLDAEDIRLLNGDAYELIVEAVVEERGWRDRMEPVRKDGSPQIFWVSKEVVSDTSHGYDIVQL